MQLKIVVTLQNTRLYAVGISSYLVPTVYITRHQVLDTIVVQQRVSNLNSKHTLFRVSRDDKFSDIPQATDMVTSDSEAGAPRAKQNQYSSKKKKQVSSPEPEPASDSEGAPGEEQEEEYEIEEVIDSQKGYFGDVRLILIVEIKIVWMLTYDLGQIWLFCEMDRLSFRRQQLGSRG